jgi:hypothetical protein
LNTARVKIEEFGYKTSYTTSPIKDESALVIEGSFYQQKPITVHEMINRRINKTLCFFLGIAISITFVSYYIAMNYEARLNNLDNEIVRLNSENQDLQAELDRYKSFNNVDTKIEEFNLLQKAEKVIEVTALNSDSDIKTVAVPVKTAANKFNWAIGY